MLDSFKNTKEVKMGDTVEFRGKFPLETKRTRLRHFTVVRHPSGKVMIEFASEQLDEYRVKHFEGLAEDAAEAVRYAHDFLKESNASLNLSGDEPE